MVRRATIRGRLDGRLDEVPDANIFSVLPRRLDRPCFAAANVLAYVPSCLLAHASQGPATAVFWIVQTISYVA